MGAPSDLGFYSLESETSAFLTQIVKNLETN